MEFKDFSKDSIKISLPNRDSYVGPLCVVPKEVLIKSYIDQIGETFNFNGMEKKVVSVTITEETIELIIE
jgi:hypothetical protein